MAHWAEPVLVAGTTFSSAINTLRDDNAHELHVLASQTVAECYAPGWLAGFRAAYPDTNVKMSVHNSAFIMEQLADGDDRLGLVESPTVHAGLSAVPVGHDQLVVIVRPDHPWARRRSPLIWRGWLARRWWFGKRDRAPGTCSTGRSPISIQYRRWRW